jgi:apolipoprotein N-acyltransferase
VELARAYITGFPWDLLGTTQIDNIPLSRIASITGVYGLSFEIALVNTAVAAAFLVPHARRKLLLAASLLVVMVLHSGKLVKFAALPTTQGVTLVQPNIPILDSDAWTLDYLQNTLAELSALSVRPVAERSGTPGLILWPESPAPFFTTDYHLRMALGSIARKTNSSIVAGTLGITHTGDPNHAPEIFNSASVVATDGSWTQQYDKIHLVPFGEYVPVAQLLSFAKALTHEVGTFARGTKHDPLTVDGTRVGVFICYESVFPGEVRRFSRNGAEVYVNISNDGWFGDTGAPRQHLNMARMRAVENNRWLLRDTNSGITAVIDPLGRVTKEAPANARTALQAAYDVEESTTFYARHGDWFPILCAIITIAGVLAHFRRLTMLEQPQVA